MQSRNTLALALVSSILVLACGSPATSPDTGAGSDAAPSVDAGRDAPTAADANSVDASASPDAPIVACTAHTFVVTSDGASYTIDGVAGNPTLQLCPGVTYMFDLTAVSSFHPMGLSAGVTSFADFPGGATTSYMTPAAAPFPTEYRCTIHGFGGIVTVP